MNTTTAKEQEFSSVAMDAPGNFVVTWSSKDQDGTTGGFTRSAYDAAGAAQGAEFQVNTYTTNEQMHPSVAMDADGDFVITWTSKDQDGNGWGIYARQYTAAGVAKGGETLVNTTTSGDQEYSSVAMDAKGGFVVVWTGNGPGDSLGVFGQRFSIPTPLTFVLRRRHARHDDHVPRHAGRRSMRCWTGWSSHPTRASTGWPRSRSRPTTWAIRDRRAASRHRHDQHQRRHRQHGPDAHADAADR